MASPWGMKITQQYDHATFFNYIFRTTLIVVFYFGFKLRIPRLSS